MQTISKRKSWKSSPSFALISVLALVSLAALTATAFLASARLERQATSSIGNATRLEMALDSGKICASQVIGDNTQPDVGNTHVILYWRTNWTDELGYPFIGQIRASNTASWYYFPLFSPAGLTNLNTNNYQTAMRFTNTHQGAFSNEMQSNMTSKYTNGFAANPGLNHPTCVQIPLLGGRTSPPVGWVYLHQEKRQLGSALTNTSPVVRIAWFTEDLEGLIDAERMGATTSRSTGTNAEEISLASASDSSGALIASVANFTNNRKAYISYGLLSSTSVSGLANPTNARYFASGLRSWAPTNAASPTNGALAWIPVGIPVDGTATAPLGYSNQGYTKFNLNNLATNSGSAGQALTNIAQIITSNLSTNFLARAGGLTNNNRFDYAKCIAANIVDYIDSDSTPSIETGTDGYRGCEALPLVSEAAISIQWTNQVKTNIGALIRYEEEIEVVHLVEFWNMFNKPFSGTVNFGMSNTFSGNFVLTEFNPNKTNLIVPSSPGNLTNPYVIANLLPNEYRVFASPPIRYKVLSGIGLEPVWSGKTAKNGANVPLGRSGSTGSDNFSSGWTLSVNNVIYDQAINYEEIQNLTGLKCEAFNSASAAPPRFKAHIPALRLDAYPSISDIYGTGDNRMTFFMTNATTVNGPAVFNASGFDDRGSFGYRNKVWGKNDTGSTNRPDLWLDGGHANSPLGSGPTPGGSESRVYDKNGAVTAKFATVLAQKTPSLAIQKEAPAYIADARMTNIFELGRIFDPMQWRTAIPDSSPPTNIMTSTLPDYQQGGGNTLRIGRAEHPRFAFTNMYGNSVPSIPNMGMSSAALLDLFCLTNGTSPNGGPYSLGGGKINLNTAPAPVLRALAGGILLTNDPAQVPASYTIPIAMAEAFAQGVMRFRSKYPFLTPSHLSFIGTDPAWPNTNSWPTNSVFGNTNRIALSPAPGNTFGSTARLSVTQSSDQAAEEWFSKIYSLSSCQSHNFRIYVVAQLVATNSSGTNAVGPLAKKYYQIYARNTNNSNMNQNQTNSGNQTIYTWTPAINTIDIYKSTY